MKRFTIHLAIFLAIPIVPIILLYILRPSENQRFFDTLNEKIHLLDSIESPRIIMIGGSNVYLGFDSQRMSDSLGIPIINTGTNANYGIKYHIELVEKRLKPNDILLIQPEVDQFYGMMNGSYTNRLAIAMISTSLQDLELLNRNQLGVFITGFPSALYTYYLTKSGTNSKDLMNACGDEISHWNDTTQFELLPEQYSSDLEPDKQAISYLSHKISKFEREGHKVLFMPPVMIESYYKTDPRLQRAAKEMAEAGAPFSVPYYSHVMPDTFRYDTQYHLNKIGVDSLTQLVISQIRQLDIISDSK